MCAAAGNLNMSGISYPASNPLVIAVGASDPQDNRKSPTSDDDEDWWGSNFGPEISVAAPGVLIPTTDRGGTEGYNPVKPPKIAAHPNNYTNTDYHKFFNGTSAATPHVAGLAALIRSLYPNFRNTRVRDIIERNADKVGAVPYSNTAGHPNGPWNEEMGYGRINALNTITNLWIAWKGTNLALNVMNVFSSFTKRTLVEMSDYSPSMAAFKNSFWIAWAGTDLALNFMDVFDPSTKLTFGEKSDQAPSIAAFRNTLWIAWKGTNLALNFMDVFDPSTTKQSLVEMSDYSPSITPWSAPTGSGLWIAWTGTDLALNVMEIRPVPDPSTKLSFSEMSDQSPSITAKGDRLWIAWKGTDLALNFMETRNPLAPGTKRTLVEKSDYSPSITTLKNSSIWIAWTGTDLALNVMNVLDPSIKLTSVEKSDQAPSLNAFDHQFYPST